ncbi:MAG: NAD(+) synthase, partial [Bacteroidales bacterium]|nr:NAD(+) synthase [Bacteroidales bacterium]
IGLSGGIDSSVSMALAAKAFGPEKLFGVMMPEKDSSPDSEELARELAEKFGVEVSKEVITGALDGFGCYKRRDQAVKEVIPEYDPTVHKMKIGIKHEGKGSKLPPLFHLTVVNPDGSEIVKRLPSLQMRTIIAASNFKQRARMSLLYYHAEQLHYAVIGTPNRHEVEQGFFVKYGDGGGDVFPIGKLYKTQVYQVAEYLGVPQGIIDRTPTTDTYSAEQTQEEFFYEFPHEIMDLLWYAYENKCDAAEVGNVMGMTAEEIERNYRNFERRSITTDYLRTPPINDYDFV